MTSDEPIIYGVALHKGFGYRLTGVGADYKAVAEALAEQLGAEPDSDGLYWVHVRKLPLTSADGITPQEAYSVFNRTEHADDHGTRVATGTLKFGEFDWQTWGA